MEMLDKIVYKFFAGLDEFCIFFENLFKKILRKNKNDKKKN